MATLDQIRRHPVKGLGAELLDRAALTPGAALPWDRTWAIAHGRSEFDPDRPEWVKSRNFVILTTCPALSQVRCALDEAEARVTLSHPALGEISVRPDSDGARLTDWIAPIAGASGPPPYFLARRPGAAMTDFPDSHISIGSLSSQRALAQMAGLALDPGRFRMNLWIEGLAPWEEFDWQEGAEITVGSTRLRITGRVKRCNAPNADPDTGKRNTELQKLLHGRFGHMDFGVYAEVIEGGAISVGDRVAA